MRMASRQENSLALFRILAFCALLSTSSAVVSDTDCDPNSNDLSTGEAAVCTAVNVNAECPAGKDKCACKDGYKEGSPNTNTCVLKAVSEYACDPTDKNSATGGAAVCKAVDDNAECPATKDKCVCKDKYKEGDPDSRKCVLMEIADFSCDPSNDHATTGGAAVCKAVNANAECPDGERSCKCKSGYKQHETVVNSCAKVLGGTCTSADDCTTPVANSVCSAKGKCECKDTYKEESAACKKAKLITATTCTSGNGGGTTCHDIDSNAECPTDGTHCACKADYFLNSGKTTCVKKITSVDCVTGVAGTEACKLVDENSDCPADGDKCACKEGYSGIDSCAKDAGSSATSAWMTTSLFVTAVLVYLPRLICG